MNWPQLIVAGLLSGLVATFLAAYFFPKVLDSLLTSLRLLLGEKLAERLGLAPIAHVQDEVVVTIEKPGGALPSAVTYYFNNKPNRQCYMFTLPGRWKPAGESGLLRPETNDQATAGVLVFSAADLAEFEGADLIARAATQIRSIYETRAVGRRISEIHLLPFPSSRPGTMKWEATWSMGQMRGIHAAKVFAEVTPGWVAQVTVNGTSDNDALIQHILQTLETTSDPEGYRPLVRSIRLEMFTQRFLSWDLRQR